MIAPCIDVLCCALTAIDDNSLRHYEALLSDEELARLRSFRSPTGAKEFLIGRALLRSALAERLNCSPRALQFAKNADGKPALVNPVSCWQFNLTHSHSWVALALCEGGSIGIDIESYSRRNNLPAIAQRFFSDAENAQLVQCDEREWLDYFFAVWTLKEAHAKALGCGLPKILPCSSIAVDLSARAIGLTLSGAAHTEEKIASWWYKLDAQCALAVVAHGAVDMSPTLWQCAPAKESPRFSLQPIALAPLACGRQ